MPKIVNVEEKKQEIYKAATQVFFDKGYASTTLGDIAKASKIGRSTIYQYFKNKEEIFHEVCISFFSELVSSLDEILTSDLPATEKLKKMLGVFVFENGADTKRFFQLAKVLLFLKANSSIFESKFKFFYLSVQDMFYQVVEKGIRSGDIKPCDPESMTLAIFGLAQSIILHTYLNSQTSSEDYLKAVCLMIDGIRAKE
ncbi:MAG: TetR/AcrR family transcriptional regulator [Peptostreptococcaceae bacterium]|nr:TetR/AcrR family transcriptional regulator [Peptostreptococcaceae bacterium]